MDAPRGDEQAVPIRPSRARELDDVGLIARVYYNRGTSLLLQNEYRRAARYLERSCQLDPSDEAARRNRITAWNAWALELCDQERFSDAVQVLADCLHFAPEEPATLQNDLHIHHRWTLALCQQHRFPEALQLLESGYARQPQAELYDEGRWTVIARVGLAGSCSKEGFPLPRRCSPRLESVTQTRAD